MLEVGSYFSREVKPTIEDVSTAANVRVADMGRAALAIAIGLRSVGQSLGRGADDYPPFVSNV